ncbi:hypothetical protein, partial [Peribacillus simplex]|uniref:hypothetical protein n=1 Tax=Peribacillus simplex TaxID=1478 RepID=UPI001C867F76
SPTARGKRVPGVEINVQIVQAIKIDKLDFHRVCLQSVSPPIKEGFYINSPDFCYSSTTSAISSKSEITIQH